MIHFKLNITPRGQGRPRAAKRGAFVTVYKASKDRVHEDTIASLAAQYCPPEPIDYPVRLDVLVLTPRTAAMLRVGKKGQPLGGTEREWNTSKPDVDNYCKALLDAMQSFWVDDRLVVELHARKVYAARWEHPGFQIVIQRADLVPGTEAERKDAAQARAVGLLDEVG